MGTAFSPLSLLLVALGGAAGSVLRYAVSHAGVVLFGTGFPWGTLAVNIIGSALVAGHNVPDSLTHGSAPLSANKKEPSKMLISSRCGGHCGASRHQ
ncbi:MAG: CrcB family protein [Roseomonas sp.]|nr:CrcB family protein [Roseomonas sp.]